jgi:hypothetical protein
MQVAHPLLVSEIEFHHALNIFRKQVLNALQKPVRLQGVKDAINISV